MLWMFMVYPYIKSVQVFNCPSVQTTFTGGYTGDMRYGYNSGYLADKQDADLPAVSAIIAFAETESPGNPYRIYYNPTTQAFDTVNGGTLAPRHNDGMNCAYADGHVKWVKRTAILTNNLAWIGTP